MSNVLRTHRLHGTAEPAGLTMTEPPSASVEAAWTPEPPYEAPIVCVPDPVADGGYLTEQLLVKVRALPSGTRAHESGPMVPGPVMIAKVAVPDGSDGVPPDCVSVTVAVQLVAAPTRIESGEQVTTVEVDLGRSCRSGSG